ncbi:hypothetical protein A0H81_00749 [Grifola frondosa]|uniref:Uncharacterized protein n=1 Tax=Grifola frondosa TaxID=5627 RepID=A0A1C7MNP7_GRIFR|nr:hypothetical protein A0H81_00749 [Grifola frondosa]
MFAGPEVLIACRLSNFGAKHRRPEKEGVILRLVGSLLASLLLPPFSLLSRSMAASSRWRRPPRKVSTPWFPGAWPNGSTQDRNDWAASPETPPSTQGLVDLEANLPVDRAHRRWTYGGAVAPASPESGFTPLSASLSQESKMTNLTYATDTSTATSEALATPEPTDPANFTWSSDSSWPSGNKHKSFILSHSLNPGVAQPFRISRPQSVIVKSGNIKHLSSGNFQEQRRVSSTHLDTPLLNFVPGLPPLSLPLSNLSVNFASSPDSPPAPPSPCSHTSSTPSSFAIPSPVRESANNFSEPRRFLETSGLAQNFYPIPDTEEQTLPTPSSSFTSSFSYINGDSPVLPAEDDSAHTPGRTPAQAFSPASRDLDAFALAAAVADSASRSSLSIPPSLRSASAPALEPSASACPTETERRDPRSRAYTGTSATSMASLAVATSGGHQMLSPDMCSYRVKCDCGFEDGYRRDDEKARARRRSAPPPLPLPVSPRPTVRPTISSRVDVGSHGSAGRERPVKLLVMGRVRKIGERIRGLFKVGKANNVVVEACEVPGASSGPDFGLMTTTTAVTAIEYESEHPIPIPSPRAKATRAHRRSLPLQTAHTAARRDSFLPLKPDTSTTSRPIISRPFQVGPRSKAPGDAHIHSEDEVAHSDEPGSAASRPRRQTAPHPPVRTPNKREERKARRFSLSSALSKSKLETLRTTVMPHPPLPPLPPRARRTVRVSSASARLGRMSAADEQDQEPAGNRTRNSHQFWGGELPILDIRHVDGDGDCAETSNRARRLRTQTVPSSPPPPSAQVDMSTPTQDKRRSRRFSLSSVSKRAMRARSMILSSVRGGEEDSTPSPSGRAKHPRRARADTVTTVTNGGVQFDMLKPSPRIDGVSGGTSLARGPQPSLSVSGSGSTYYDAREQPSDGNSEPRSESEYLSPEADSDLDSMSFARTPEFSSAHFSFASSAERELYLDADSPSTPSSYAFVRGAGNGRVGSAVSLVRHGMTTGPLTKTLRLSPSLSFSFETTGVEDGEEDEVERAEQEEERGFMRALGLQFDEIARRVRDD